MLCQHCHQNEATTRVTVNINGKSKEYLLCSECAKEKGYGEMPFDFHPDFNALLGSIFSSALPARPGAVRCPVCHSTYQDIARSGKVGCAECYETFFDELMPTIRRVHGNTAHTGKRPNVFRSPDDVQTEKEPAPENKREKLKKELEEVIKAQNFERAAEIRDELREMEG